MTNSQRLEFLIATILQRSTQKTKHFCCRSPVPAAARHHDDTSRYLTIGCIRTRHWRPILPRDSQQCGTAGDRSAAVFTAEGSTAPYMNSNRASRRHTSTALLWRLHRCALFLQNTKRHHNPQKVNLGTTTRSGVAR